MDAVKIFFCNLKSNFNNFPAYFKSSVDVVNKSVSNVRLPPLNKDNVLFFYMPLQGLVSYTTLSVGVMNPHLMVRLFPKRDVTDVLFLSAGGGAALWLWSRPHMSPVAPARRFSWAFLGGCLWPLGSIFLWAILRSAVGARPAPATALGLASGAALTNIAVDYFSYIELLFSGEVQVLPPPGSPRDDDPYDLDL